MNRHQLFLIVQHLVRATKTASTTSSSNRIFNIELTPNRLSHIDKSFITASQHLGPTVFQISAPSNNHESPYIRFYRRPRTSAAAAHDFAGKLTPNLLQQLRQILTAVSLHLTLRAVSNLTSSVNHSRASSRFCRRPRAAAATPTSNIDYRRTLCSSSIKFL